jgi:hypothetical protein
MTIGKFAAGIAILVGYFDKPDENYAVGAEHDQFYVYPTDRPLSDEDVTALKAAGWFQPDVRVPDGAKSRAEAPYDPREGWSCFT